MNVKIDWEATAQMRLERATLAEKEAATLRARVAVLEAAARALVEERERVSGLLEYEAWPMLQPLYMALRDALAPRSERRYPTGYECPECGRDPHDPACPYAPPRSERREGEHGRKWTCSKCGVEFPNDHKPDCYWILTSAPAAPKEEK